MSSIFDRVPNELLTNIAYYATCGNPLGPPSDLLSLLLVNRRFASTLSESGNRRLYADVFASKFDLAPYIRHLGIERATPAHLTEELNRRCRLLRNIRQKKPCRINDTRFTPDETRSMHEMLWLAYLMLLESEGLNELQLRQYAHLDQWLKTFWFEADGASCATLAIQENDWPPNTDLASLAMWSYWFMFTPGAFLSGSRRIGVLLYEFQTIILNEVNA